MPRPAKPAQVLSYIVLLIFFCRALNLSYW